MNLSRALLWWQQADHEYTQRQEPGLRRRGITTGSLCFFSTHCPASLSSFASPQLPLAAPGHPLRHRHSCAGIPPVRLGQFHVNPLHTAVRADVPHLAPRGNRIFSRSVVNRLCPETQSASCPRLRSCRVPSSHDACAHAGIFHHRRQTDYISIIHQCRDLFDIVPRPHTLLDSGTELV
jgi:hypothetical protein